MPCKLLVAALLLALAGCAGKSLAPNNEAIWQARVVQLAGFSSIACEARSGVRRKGESWHFSLSWEQRGENFSGSGYSLLGSQIFALAGNELATSYDTGDGPTTLSSREVILEFTGIDLLPSQLFALIAAMPLEAGKQRWEGGRLTAQQLGLVSASYLDWSDYNGLLMPKLVRIKSQDNQLNLTFNDWRFTQKENGGDLTALLTRAAE